MFFEKSIRLLTVAKAQLFVKQLLTTVCGIATKRCAQQGGREPEPKTALLGNFWVTNAHIRL